MDMVKLLLDFIRAEREGNWNLHLEAFAAMLPWLTMYDHTNYAKWGPTYLADMKSLARTAPEVYEEFAKGNFVVKRSNNHFNQIPTDQATEWVNKLCKVSNGIIGITRNDQARDKFCVTWAIRSNVSQRIKILLGETDEEEDFTLTRYDVLPGRMELDETHVQSLIRQLDQFNIFYESRPNTKDSDDDSSDDNPLGRTSLLVSMATKDVATEDIVSDLMAAEEKGKNAVIQNVENRLVNCSTSFFDPVRKLKSRTFASLYKVTVSSKKLPKL